MAKNLTFLTGQSKQGTARLTVLSPDRYKFFLMKSYSF